MASPLCSAYRKRASIFGVSWTASLSRRVSCHPPVLHVCLALIVWRISFVMQLLTLICKCRATFNDHADQSGNLSLSLVKTCLGVLGVSRPRYRKYHDRLIKTRTLACTKLCVLLFIATRKILITSRTYISGNSSRRNVLKEGWLVACWCNSSRNNLNASKCEMREHARLWQSKYSEV